MNRTYRGKVTKVGPIGHAVNLQLLFKPKRQLRAKHLCQDS